MSLTAQHGAGSARGKFIIANQHAHICIRQNYLFDKRRNKLYVNEINSVPGSLAYGLWSDDYGMTEYGAALVQQALDDFRAEQTLITDFQSEVLTRGGGKK